MYRIGYICKRREGNCTPQIWIKWEWRSPKPLISQAFEWIGSTPGWHREIRALSPYLCFHLPISRDHNKGEWGGGSEGNTRSKTIQIWSFPSLVDKLGSYFNFLLCISSFWYIWTFDLKHRELLSKRVIEATPTWVMAIFTSALFIGSNIFNFLLLFWYTPFASTRAPILVVYLGATV